MSSVSDESSAEYWAEKMRPFLDDPMFKRLPLPAPVQKILGLKLSPPEYIRPDDAINYALNCTNTHEYTTREIIHIDQSKMEIEFPPIPQKHPLLINLTEEAKTESIVADVPTTESAGR